MSSEDDLRINTLHRFAKHSPRLTLQEYSHCEVPAGCGGVVLRWINPQLGPRANITIGLAGTAETWLDGERLATDNTPFPAGCHVLAFHLTKLRRWETNDATYLLVPPVPVSVEICDDGPTGGRAGDLNRLGNAHPFRACWSTAPFAEPPTAVDFDDRAWVEAESIAEPTLAALPDRLRRFFERSAETGRTLFQIGTATMPPFDEAWLRLTFTLDVTQ